MQLLLLDALALMRPVVLQLLAATAGCEFAVVWHTQSAEPCLLRA
jgi:hypothetical protein